MENQFKHTGKVSISNSTFESALQKEIMRSLDSKNSYIQHRKRILEILESISKEELERNLHTILKGIPIKPIPKRTDELQINTYLINLWILDDRFLTFPYVLEEAEIPGLIGLLNPSTTTTEYTEIKESYLSDISIFFSNYPNQENKSFDIVLVKTWKERKVLESLDIYKINYHLCSLSRELLKYFGYRLHHIWIYVIGYIIDEVKLALIDQEFKPLSSCGELCFRSRTIHADYKETLSVFQNCYFMDCTALLENAVSRNETFLRILMRNEK